MTHITIYNNEYSYLKEIDWGFMDAQQDLISQLHPYPAKFIESIPRTLLQKISFPENTAILDPFCGSGTTLYEASKMGLSSYGVDLNPIACLISKVRNDALPNSFIEIAEQIVKGARERYISEEYTIPEIPNLNHWFKDDIQKAITVIITEIHRQEDTLLQNALLLALSSIIVRVSNQESDTRYAAIDNNNEAKDVFDGFVRACKKLENAKKGWEHAGLSHVINKDILRVQPAEIVEPIGMVITSPPYPNAYEYWLYHKYRMWWLGYDPIDVRSYEIGARPHYQKKNGQTEEDFRRQMTQVFDLFDAVLVEGGIVCIVIGRSLIKGREIDNAEMMMQIGREKRYEVLANIEREIVSSRKSFNPSYGKIKTENIVILRKVN